MVFNPGQIIARRYFRGRINTWLQAAVVVADDPSGLLLWQPVGSAYLKYRDGQGRSIKDLPIDQLTGARLIHTTWVDSSVLMLHPPGEAYSVWWFFRDGDFVGWYVNFEAPYVRGEHGIDTTDHALDLLVRPDLSVVWKDEDEFVARTGLPGYWSRGQAAAIRVTAQRVATLATAGAYPFDGTHRDFRPDPAWPVPGLPAGWDRPPVAAAG